MSFGNAFSIMISCLHKIDSIMADDINQPVFLCNPPGPDTGPKKFERLGFADTLERVSHDGLDQLKNPDGRFAVGFHPIAEVIPEFRLKHGFSLPFNTGRLLFAFTQIRPHPEGPQSSGRNQTLSGPCQGP